MSGSAHFFAGGGGACRLEDERKTLNDMKKQNEALEAMVVARTAELTMKQEPLVRRERDCA